MLKKKPLIILLLFLGLIFFGAFIYSVVVIGKSVKDNCEITQEKYSDDCVESHLKFLQNEELSSKEWAHYIWSLGQMGDSRTSYYLESVLKDNPCQENLKDYCAYEVEKALKWSKTNRNILSPLWRSFFL